MSTKASSNEKCRTSDLLQLVTFGLGNEEYAVDILKVQEINRLREITKVPKTPHYVDGVINLRGKVIPVINLRKKCALSEREDSILARIMVMETRCYTVGVVVDYVSEVLRISADIVEPAPVMTATGLEDDFIRAISKVEDRLVTLVDIDSLIDGGGVNLQPLIGQ